jgi:phytoene/squalene synthetase
MAKSNPDALTGLELYTLASEKAASAVIDAYSTSFGMAVSLLAPKYRQHVANIYALVRVADEVVDGSAMEAKRAGGSVDPASAIDDLEKEVYRAVRAKYSTNLIVHAFAHTANQAGIGRDLIKPFFDSMRTDLWKTKYDQRSFEQYIYGSAEVIGLMCLKVFLMGENYSNADNAKMVAGARALGSAFQKVNFLRDLGADNNGLGRSYFPGLEPKSLTNAKRDELVADIRGELKTAAKSQRILPKGARRAVGTAQMLFQVLNDLISITPAEKLMSTRIRVPDWYKLVMVIRVVFGWFPR